MKKIIIESKKKPLLTANNEVSVFDTLAMAQTLRIEDEKIHRVKITYDKEKGIKRYTVVKPPDCKDCKIPMVDVEREPSFEELDKFVDITECHMITYECNNCEFISWEDVTDLCDKCREGIMIDNFCNNCEVVDA